jgi:hypothetical protein
MRVLCFFKLLCCLSFVLNEQIDIWGFRTPFLFLEWIGMNAMLVFVMAAQGIFAAFVNGWYNENPDNSLVSIINMVKSY